ncbi:hypothetical protein ACRAWF_20450, partial [Streptomyces sp. L7]
MGLGRYSADLLGVRPARHGRRGLKRATQVAVLSANFHIAEAARTALPRALHRARWALRRATSALSICGRSARRPSVSVDDIAKRLIGYGFHAPTMSFPVAGTLMIEPSSCTSFG